MDNVIYPTLDYLEISGNPYLGILGVNGILAEDDKMFILGWQSFTQDCDTDAIFNTLEDDIYNLFESCIVGSFSDEVESINYNNNQSVSVVLMCKNKENSENIINGIDALDENALLSFSSTVTKNKYLEYEAQNGQVMVITSCASSLSKASDLVYENLSRIDFRGISYRKDICRINNRS